MTAADEVRSVLARLSAAWRDGDEQALTALLHPDVVFVHPGFAGEVPGREACIESYRQFLAAARVVEYRETPPVVHVWHETATARYGWEMTWETGGKVEHAQGHDVFVLTRDQGGWTIVWRALSES